MLLDNGSLATRLASTDDKERFPFYGVLVTVKESIATDGHVLAIVRHAPDPAEEFPLLPFAPPPEDLASPVLVPGEMMDLAAKAMPGQASARASLTVDDEGCALAVPCGDKGSDVVRGEPLLAGAFPAAYRKLIPKGDPKYVITLNAALVVRLAKIGKACAELPAKGGNLPVVLEIYEGVDQVVVKVPGAPRFYGLAMPMKDCPDTPSTEAEASVPEEDPTPEPVEA